jgi:DNA ligase 1
MRPTVAANFSRQFFGRGAALTPILREGSEDLLGLPFAERRRRLEAWYVLEPRPGLDCRRLCRLPGWAELRELRYGARERSIEGLML